MRLLAFDRPSSAGFAKLASPLRLGFALALLGAFAAGCGGEDTATAAPDGGSGNGPSSSLSISGRPPSAITQGTSFSFTPVVANAAGGTLAFSAANLPAWATLNDATGRISGTPGPNDVGTYANITITVSNGQGSVTSPSFTVEVVGTAAGSATLSWMPPSEYVNGQPLGPALAGYRVYWGTSPDNLANAATLENPGITTYVVEQLTPATWYFAATAFDAEGLESDYSNVATKTIL